jgi:hypothetical protein
LIELLYERIYGHWFVDCPLLGSGYRWVSSLSLIIYFCYSLLSEKDLLWNQNSSNSRRKSDFDNEL